MNPNKVDTSKVAPKAPEHKESFTKKVGDAVERLGEKVSNAGVVKTGEAISRAGDKLEHSRDNKNRGHS